jgi:hypothetical protein
MTYMQRVDGVKVTSLSDAEKSKITLAIKNHYSIVKSTLLACLLEVATVIL